MKLVILETSDVHGNIYPINYINNAPKEVGLGKLATLVRRERQRCPNVLLVDNGDMIQGTPLLYYFARFDRKRPNPMVVLNNRLGCDAAVFGNHDFNFGQPVLQAAVHDSKFPWLAANIVDATTHEPYYGKPYVIRTFSGGPRVAVLGLVTKYIPVWEKPEHIRGMRFEDPVAAAKRWVPWLRQEKKADVVVVSYHGGFERDLGDNHQTETPTGENQGSQLCREVGGIDVLLSGHQHRQIAGRQINGVTIVQPGANGSFLGKVTLDLEPDGGRWTIAGKRSELVSVKSVPADKELLKLADAYEKDVQEWLDQPLGRIEGDMAVRDPLAVRMHDHPLIEFINRLQMKTAGVDISETALFNNDAPGLPPDVSMRDIVANYVYPNSLKVIRISGADMKAALERSASYFTLDQNRRIGVSPSFTTPKPQHYNYDMWEGIDYVIDLSRPVGSRIVRLDYHGEPVRADGQYDVVMNNYRAGGGGDYPMFRGKPVIKDIPVDVTEIIANEILEKKVIRATVDNNWKLIY